MKIKEKNNTDISVLDKITLKGFIDYVQSNVLLIILTIMLLLVTHGYLLFNNNIGIDTDSFITIPEGNHNWLHIGRYGLVVEKYILNLDSYNIFYAETLFMVFLGLFCTVTYYMIYVLSGKDFKLLNLILPLIGLTNPLFVEQFIFLLQSAQISFSLFLTVLATLCVYKWIIDKKWVYGIINVALLVLILGTYQSFIPVYIAFCVFAFILLCENDEFSFKNNKDFWIQIIKLVATFGIAFLIYQIILKCMKVDMGYLNQSNYWLWDNPINCIKRTYYHLLQLLRAEGNYYNFGLPVGLVGVMVIGIINSIKIKKNLNKFNKLVYFAVYGVFVITPILLTLYLGNPAALRTQFYIPLIEALALILLGYYLTKSVKFNKVLMCAFFVVLMLVYSDQASVTSKLYYGDHLTRQNDIQVAYELMHDMTAFGITQNDFVYFYGHYDDRMNKSAMSGEAIGYSLFENGWMMNPKYWFSTESILKIFRALGYDYPLMPSSLAEGALKVGEEIEACWPQEGCMKKVDGYYVIKLSEE